MVIKTTLKNFFFSSFFSNIANILLRVMSCNRSDEDFVFCISLHLELVTIRILNG